jgi:pimeloyl-ACP methyl ester carboxylesterase
MADFADLVILLPGITGSVLANQAGKEVWAPSGGAVWRAITSFGGSIEGLELAGDEIDDGVTATRLVPDVSLVPGLIKIDGYSRVSDYLVAQLGLREGQNFRAFPYDWRRDNRVNAKRLEAQALTWLKDWRAESGNAAAKLVLIGHSMGGLISRYFIECLGGWQHTRTLMTLGTPHRGSLSAVGFLENGMKKGIGPFGLDLSPLLRSLTSVYQLLPIYPCVIGNSSGGGELQRVAQAAQAGILPHVDAARAAAARAFHQEIQDAQARNAQNADYAERGPALIPVVGIEQPTAQTADMRSGKLVLQNSYEGQDLGGDGTVPRVSATPIELSDAKREIYAAETHGALQNADGTLANLRGVLTRDKIDLRKFQRAEDAAMLTLEVDDVVLPGEAVAVRVRASEGNPKVGLTLTPLAGGAALEERLTRDAEPGWQQGRFALAPGVWRITAAAEGATTVSELVVVAAP